MVHDLGEHASLVLLTDGVAHDRMLAKTAWCLMRFAPERVRGIVDPVHTGRRVADICPGIDLDVPIVADLADVARHGDSVVVATARNGGLLSDSQRETVLQAAHAGHRVLNTGHDVIEEPGIVNLRRFRQEDRCLGDGRPRSGATRVLTVGTTSSVGKMTVTVLLTRALQAAGRRADWLATGQTGMILRGRGHVLDAIPLDFAAGVVERDLAETERDADIVVVEGQGALLHPMWGAADFTFAKVVRPHWIVVCTRLSASAHEGFDARTPTVERVVEAHAALADLVGYEQRLLGVAVDAADVDRRTLDAECARLGEALGVPVVDPVRDGVDPFVRRL